MSEIFRASDETELLKTIKMQLDKIKNYTEELSRYKIDFEVEVDEDFSIKIKAIKPFGGGGVIKTITKQTALYYAKDVSTLTDEIIEEVYNVLLKDILRVQLMPMLARAISNVNVMESKYEKKHFSSF